MANNISNTVMFFTIKFNRLVLNKFINIFISFGVSCLIEWKFKIVSKINGVFCSSNV